MSRQLPDRFKFYLREALGGTEEFLKVLYAIEHTNPVISIRINPFKPLSGDVDSIVRLAKEQNDPVPWCKEGFYLSERPNFTLDPSFHAGAYYVQEASSMFLSLLEPFLRDRESVLDLCAAPGGKSTHLISMRYGKRFLANEIIRKRYQILKENIVKWGDISAEMTSKDPAVFAKEAGERGCFDFILVDAPCSGEGMFRKDPRTIEEWSPENVAICAVRQRRILSDIWPSLLPGGILVYSTCTFNIYENDRNVLWLIKEYDVEIIYLDESLIQEWGIKKSTLCGYRFYPGLVRGEGLFFAVLRKPDEKEAGSIGKRNIAKIGIGDGMKNCKKTGQKRSGWEREKNINRIPTAEEAFTVDHSCGYPSVELTKEQAVKYLCGETIMLKEASLGYLRVTYGNLGLGFVKNLGNRANNLYPKNWRIKNIRNLQKNL